MQSRPATDAMPWPPECDCTQIWMQDTLGLFLRYGAGPSYRDHRRGPFAARSAQWYALPVSILGELFSEAEGVKARGVHHSEFEFLVQNHTPLQAISQALLLDNA